MDLLVTRESTSGFGKTYPEFWINVRPDTPSSVRDNGAHVCLRVPTEDAVIQFHEVALLQGGSDAGAPAAREAASTSYFGAFIFDLDNNKIEALSFPRTVPV